MGSIQNFNFLDLLGKSKLNFSQLETEGKIRGWDEFGRHNSDRDLTPGAVRIVKLPRIDATEIRVLTAAA
jgi:hypothetical protein